MKPYLVLAFFFAMAWNAAAQEEATLQLRNGDEVTGVISDMTDDSLFLVQPLTLHYAEREQALPVLAFSRSEVLTVEFGGGPGIILPTLTGFAIGTAVGTVAAYSMDEGDWWLSKALVEGLRPITIIAGAALGTIIGAIGGLVMRSSRQVYDLSNEGHYRELRSMYNGDHRFSGSAPPDTISPYR